MPKLVSICGCDSFGYLWKVLCLGLYVESQFVVARGAFLSSELRCFIGRDYFQGKSLGKEADVLRIRASVSKEDVSASV